ncbi:LysR family transcriptional regulator [Caballeronia udeis]|uniref:LysR family transcriptional regulator n=1 Tax=Caballeronia udeis TaxID=1232866 RepID=A0A158FLU9_9BURK|nr:LysR family transcriptional regulator [Caballeronia udeis]SAL20782.1 LysR family transcriptional regulator [Caballeronia udeis]
MNRSPTTDAVQGLKTSGVSLQQLRLFVILAQHRSFTQAGNALGVTQSAASRGIRELEDLLELKLFDRTTRQVALTDTGRALLPRIALLVDELEAALRFGRQVSTAESGAVSIASSSSLVASVLPALLSSCRASYPNIALTLHDAPARKVLELVRAGDADMGVLAGPLDDSNPHDLCDLSTQTLFSDSLCAIVPARHALASHATVRWRDLGGASLFLLDDDAGSFDLIARALDEHGASNVRLQRLTQAASVEHMVAAGLGFGIQPMHAGAASAQALVQPVQLWPPVTRPVVLVKRRGRTLQAQAACIWTHVISSYDEQHKPLQIAHA